MLSGYYQIGDNNEKVCIFMCTSVYRLNFWKMQNSEYEVYTPVFVWTCDDISFAFFLGRGNLLHCSENTLWIM